MRRSALLLLLWAAGAALASAAPAQTGGSFEGHVQAAQNALRAGLPLIAAREYRAAVRLHPDDADAHFALAGVWETAGHVEEAIREYRVTIGLRPDNAPAHNALAGLLEDRGERAAALAQYRQALAAKPADPRLHFNLAAALADGGQPGLAAAEYREALRLKPDFTEAQTALAALPPAPPDAQTPPVLQPSAKLSKTPPKPTARHLRRDSFPLPFAPASPRRLGRGKTPPAR